MERKQFIGSDIRATFTAVCVGLFVLLSAGYGQEPIRKEVRVVKPYEPSLSGAFKINKLPVMSDTVQLTPDIEYEVEPKFFQPDFEFTPLKAARMESEQISKLYPSFLKLGFGSYTTPFGEFYINSLRSKNTSLGAHVRHISSYGKTRLSNEKKVFSGYGDTDAKIYGKRIFKSSVLSAEAGVQQDWVHQYGYHPEMDTTLDKKDIRQEYLDLFGGLIIHSNHIDSSRMDYRFSANYHYFNDRFKNVQHEVNFEGKMGTGLLGGMVGGTMDVMALSYHTDSMDAPVTFIGLEPWYSKRTGAWNLDLSVDIRFEFREGKTTPHFYPRAKLLFHVVPQYLTSYVGVTGTLEQHTYRSITGENPFLVPGLEVESANRKLSFYGGFNGSFSRRSSYHLRGSFSLIDHMYFFVNDTVSSLGNTFSLEYDNVQLGRIFGEVNTDIGTRSHVSLRGNYYNYTVSVQDRAWHKPDFDIAAIWNYNIRDKILVGLEAYYVGTRYAKSYEVSRSEYVLDGFLDLNLKLEYRYSKILSAFLQFNNLLGKGYQIWNQYPVQRFSIFGGFTYAL